MDAPAILILSDEPFVETLVRHLLGHSRYEVKRIPPAEHIGVPLDTGTARLLLVDLPEVDEEASGFVKRLHDETGLPLIVLAAQPEHLNSDLDLAVYVLGRPPEPAALVQVVHTALGELTPPAGHEVDAAGPAEHLAVGEVAAMAVTQEAPARWRLVSILGGLLLLAGLLALLLPAVGVPGLPNPIELILGKKEDIAEAPPTPVELIGQANGSAIRTMDISKVRPEEIRKINVFGLPALVARKMNIPSPYQVQPRAEPHVLTLWGTLAFDPDRLARVQPRYAGEVVAVGTSSEPMSDPSGATTLPMPLQYASPVRRDQILAVVWSKELGEKKSELIDALSQLSLDQETLHRLEDLYRSGGTSEAVVRQARRNLSSSLNAVNRAERTLKIQKVHQAEIEAVREEAKRLIARKGTRDPEREKDWAKVEVRSPIDGLIVEKNVTQGQIVDPSTDLFKVADLTKLAVIANVYEEDLRALERLQAEYQPGLVPWRVFLAADERRRALVSDGIKRIGLVVDPNQRTDLVMGVVDNTDRRLRVGQFVIAEVDIPARPNAVSIPTAALDEDGQESCVLIQPDPKKPVYILRRVVVAERFHRTAYIRSRLSDREKASGLSELHEGEWVVTGGAVQLRAALEEARAREEARVRAREENHTHQ